jgi:hypothetical protein
MIKVNIVEMKYFSKSYDITDGKATREGLIIEFEREDKSIYKWEFSVSKTSFDISSISKKFEEKFVKDLVLIYRLFKGDPIPTISDETCEGFCKKYIKAFNLNNSITNESNSNMV